MRRMLFAVGALAAVLIYLIWWVTYAGIHYTPRYAVRPPGVAGEVQGTSVRLLSLTRRRAIGRHDRKTNQASQSFPTLVAYGSSPSSEAVRHDPGRPLLRHRVAGSTAAVVGSGGHRGGAGHSRLLTRRFRNT